MKASAAQSLLQSLSEALRAAAESPRLTRVIMVGHTDFDDLDDAEKSELFLWLFAWFRIVEQAHQHYKMGNIEEGTWRGQTAHLKSLLIAPAVARFWEARRFAFSEEFAVFVDSLDLDGPTPSVIDALRIFGGESGADRLPTSSSD